MLAMGETLCGHRTSDTLAGWMDMDVETAENDRIASILATMSLVEDRPYEAVLIDVQMPDASGLEAARWLRRHGWLGPIIATGDAAGNEASKRSLEAGCDSFIDKPLSNEKLKAAYAKQLEQGAEDTPLPLPRNPKRQDAKRRNPKRPRAMPRPSSSAPRRWSSTMLSACRRSLRCFLQKMEIEADVAENGQAACDMAMQSLAAGHPYDVILMDIQMPKMDGKKALKWLREKNWNGPIIAISSHATPRDHAAFLTAGCNECLAKPITNQVLCGALQRYVQC